MNSNIEFLNTFKKNDLERIVTKLTGLINQARPHDKDYYERNFATNLYKLGIKIQDDGIKRLLLNYKCTMTMRIPNLPIGKLLLNG